MNQKIGADQLSRQPDACSSRSNCPTSARSQLIAHRSLLVRIAHVAFYCEVFTEAVQMQLLDLGRLAEVAESCAPGEGNRSGSGENLGGVVQENFVHGVGRERGPVYRGSTLDHDADDFEFAEAAEDRRQVGMPVGLEGGYLLDSDAELLQPGSLAWIRGAAKDQHVVPAGGCGILYQARIEGKAQARIQNDAQQRPPARPSAAVGEQRIVRED